MVWPIFILPPKPDNSARIKELEGEIASIDARISELESQIEGINSGISLASNAVTTIESDITLLKAMNSNVLDGICEQSLNINYNANTLSEYEIYGLTVGCTLKKISKYFTQFQINANTMLTQATTLLESERASRRSKNSELIRLKTEDGSAIQA